MSDFTIEQLEALKEGTTPGPWAAIADHPYISIVIANDIDQIHAPIVDITDGTTDEPEVDKHHELMAAAPALVDALIAEKRAHQRLRAEIEAVLDVVKHETWLHDDEGQFPETVQLGSYVAGQLTRILEATDE